MGKGKTRTVREKRASMDDQIKEALGVSDGIPLTDDELIWLTRRIWADALTGSEEALAIRQKLTAEMAERGIREER